MRLLIEGNYIETEEILYLEEWEGLLDIVTTNGTYSIFKKDLYKDVLYRKAHEENKHLIEQLYDTFFEELMDKEAKLNILSDNYRRQKGYNLYNVYQVSKIIVSIRDLLKRSLSDFSKYSSKHTYKGVLKSMEYKISQIKRDIEDELNRKEDGYDVKDWYEDIDILKEILEKSTVKVEIKLNFVINELESIFESCEKRFIDLSSKYEIFIKQLLSLDTNEDITPLSFDNIETKKFSNVIDVRDYKFIIQQTPLENE